MFALKQKLENSNQLQIVSLVKFLKAHQLYRRESSSLMALFSRAVHKGRIRTRARAADKATKREASL